MGCTVPERGGGSASGAPSAMRSRVAVGARLRLLPTRLEGGAGKATADDLGVAAERPRGAEFSRTGFTNLWIR